MSPEDSLEIEPVPDSIPADEATPEGSSGGGGADDLMPPEPLLE